MADATEPVAKDERADEIADEASTLASAPAPEQPVVTLAPEPKAVPGPDTASLRTWA